MVELSPADVISKNIIQTADEESDRIIRRVKDILDAKNSFKNANDLTMLTAKEKTTAWGEVKSLKMHPIYQDYKNFLTMIETLYKYLDEIDRVINKK